MGGGGKGSSKSSSPQFLASPPQTTTQVINSDPWGPQQSYLQNLFSEASSSYKNPMEFYGGSVEGVPTGQTYASFSPETQAALEMAGNQALNTDPTITAAQNYSQDMLSGKYLDAENPYFSKMVENISNTVTPQLTSQFGKSGRYGSGSMDKAIASSVTDAAGNLAYQNYGDVMKQMAQAAYLAPQTAQLGYLPSQMLAQVGATKEDQTQNAINQEMQKWQFEQMEPWQRLGLYQGAISGNYGGATNATGTTTGGGSWYEPKSSSSGGMLGGVGSMMSGLAGLGMLGYNAYSSDIRTKNNINPINNALKLIDQLNPVTFDYKPEYGIPGQVGFVADEIEELIPGMVFTGIDGLKKVFPFAVVPLLVKAVQELQEEVRQLRGSEKTLLTSTEE